MNAKKTSPAEAPEPEELPAADPTSGLDAMLARMAAQIQTLAEQVERQAQQLQASQRGSSVPAVEHRVKRLESHLGLPPE